MLADLSLPSSFCLYIQKLSCPERSRIDLFTQMHFHIYPHSFSLASYRLVIWCGCLFTARTNRSLKVLYQGICRGDVITISNTS